MKILFQDENFSPTNFFPVILCLIRIIEVACIVEHYMGISCILGTYINGFTLYPGDSDLRLIFLGILFYEAYSSVPSERVIFFDISLTIKGQELM